MQTVMDIFLNLATCVGVVLIVGLVIVCVGMVISDWREKHPSQSRIEEAYKDGIQESRYRLRSDAWWFSEDEPTMRLLQDLAEPMSVDDAREKWRERRREQKGGE